MKTVWEQVKNKASRRTENKSPETNLLKYGHNF